MTGLVRNPSTPMAARSSAERGWKSNPRWLEMPVTIQSARAAGREIWGYPSYVTDVPLEISDRAFSYRVMDGPGGEELLSVGCAPGPGVTTRAGDLVTFSNHEDTVLRTVVDVDAAALGRVIKALSRR